MATVVVATAVVVGANGVGEDEKLESATEPTSTVASAGAGEDAVVAEESFAAPIPPGAADTANRSNGYLRATVIWD